MAEPVVQPGERADLAETARQTGERFGSMDTLLAEHSRRLDNINGSIAHLAASMGQQAASLSVMAAAVKNIENMLGAGKQDAFNRKGLSTQWWIAILAAFVTFTGFGLTIVITLIVLLANGKLG